jgi:hypothetical protein
MNTKLLEQFKKGEVILYTPAFEDFKALMEWCDTHNIAWGDGTKGNDDKNKEMFEAYNKVCQGLKIMDVGHLCLCYCRCDFQRNEKITITAKDLEPDKQTFTKDDLKIGMIVELRNGEKCLVHKNRYVDMESSKAYIPDYYTKNLTRTSERRNEQDIVKVYTTNNLIEALEGKYDSLELVWEREQEQEIDWSMVEIDQKILVSMNNINWERRYFAKYENGLIYAWHNGCTSFTVPLKNNYDYFSPWRYAKLYKEGEY